MYARESHLETMGAASAVSVRGGATAALRAMSRLLDAWAERLSPPAQSRATDPVMEFYADSSAPEGALYIDGQLVGHVMGVSRL